MSRERFFAWHCCDHRLATMVPGQQWHSGADRQAARPWIIDLQLRPAKGLAGLLSVGAALLIEGWLNGLEVEGLWLIWGWKLCLG
jgi:hypothetical protein